MEVTIKVQSDEDSYEFNVTKKELDMMFGEEAFESQLVKFLTPPEDYNEYKTFVREALIESVKEGGTEKEVYVDGNKKVDAQVIFN